MFRNITEKERKLARRSFPDKILQVVIEAQKSTTITVTVDKTNGVITVDNPTQINVNVVVK